jgi:hypothetical protein
MLGPSEPCSGYCELQRELTEARHRINELESLMQDQSFALAEAQAKTEHFIKLYEFYLDLSETGKRELAEARAALLLFEEVYKRSTRIGAKEIATINAALKAAREAKT